jgi:hypothetical protein
MTMFMTAQDLGSEEQFAKSLAILDRLEGLLNAPSTLAEADEESPKSSITMWNKTKDQVDAEINRFCDYLRKTGEKPCLEAANKLAKAMDLFKVDLTSSLINIDEAQGDQKKLLYPKVSTLLDNYKKSILADRLLTAAEANPFVPVNAKKPLLTTLDQIQKSLEAQVSS